MFISNERKVLSILDKEDNFVNKLIKSIAMCTATAIVLCASPVKHLHADDDLRELHIVFPDRVNSIEFGEPLFLPLALINSSETDLVAPDLSNLMMDLRLIVTFAGKSEFIVFNNTMAHGQYGLLRANSSATTVVLANVWLPHVINSIKDGDSIELEMILRTENHGPESKYATSGTFEILVFGNSLKLPRQKFLSMIKHVESRPPPAAQNGSRLSPFFQGVSPLAELTSFDALDEWYNPNGNEIKMAKNLVVSDSALSRLVEVSILLARARAKSEPKAWKECSEDLHKLLKSAAALEYVFYVGELGRDIRSDSMSPPSRSETLKYVRKLFPLCVDYLHDYVVD